MGLKITNMDDGMPEVSLYGVIGDEYGGVTAEQFRREVSAIDNNVDITLRIHSEGGSYVDAIAMFSNLRSRKGATHVVIDGLAASGGSVVAQAGKTIKMARGAWMMIHEARGGMMDATADDFRQKAELLEETNDQLVRIYKPRWKGTPNQLRKAIKDETWLTADSAVESGLADAVIEAMAMAAHVDPSKFAYCHVPELLLAVEQKPSPRVEKVRALCPEIFEDAIG